MYFTLESAEEYAFMAAFRDDNPGADQKWMMGRLMEPDDKPSNLKLVVDEDEPVEEYPEFFTEAAAFFCSQRMRERLTASGVDNVEYYPLDMRERSGKRIEGYFAMNVIGRVACMDLERSKYTEWDECVARILSLALDESALKGLKILRVDEYPELILVSEEVAEALRGLAGVELRPAEGWSDAHWF